MTIINRNADRALELLEQYTPRYPHITFSAFSLGSTRDVEAAVRSADIIVTATNSSAPLFKGTLLKSGAHICAVGSYTPDARELDTATVRRSRIVLDSKAALQSGDLYIPMIAKELTEGLMTVHHVLCTLTH